MFHLQLGQKRIVFGLERDFISTLGHYSGAICAVPGMLPQSLSLYVSFVWYLGGLVYLVFSIHSGYSRLSITSSTKYTGP